MKADEAESTIPSMHLSTLTLPHQRPLKPRQNLGIHVAELSLHQNNRVNKPPIQSKNQQATRKRKGEERNKKAKLTIANSCCSDVSIKEGCQPSIFLSSNIHQSPQHSKEAPITIIPLQFLLLKEIQCIYMGYQPTLHWCRSIQIPLHPTHSRE